ncbi:TPA: ABC transporter substrate-binding protein [Streptococcus suis]|uniref:ABC transporter substrate-binding protein n=1 Tax=Streptococcus suis TaxID=1307 RepID=A0A9Q5G7L0_STRSU|nr:MULTISPECIES: ABC transporter substrate-binding protein [Streptococcus]MBY0752711.1 ABC transporter substrate-binding protein [Streptococcus sp. 2018037]MCK3848852.1 ABC transporter substrate-binding protein [Streptococcus suis]MCK3906325.1 ABC transporter substrate-binding protein [Streptococcus suis]MCK4064242.1 ABC transporter substrate-binding protein [Streptococcus suis]MCK4074297.1 ABC transporter substrate-binding protein [Streptococcus suis]
MYYKLVKKLATISVASMGLLTLAACSSSSEQASSDVVKVGVLQYMEHESLTAAREGFVAELEANGYKEGEKLVLDYQNAQGDQANLQTISEQLIDGNDIVLAIATPSAQSLATVSTETPIVFTAVTDPLSADLVESIEKPGGLLTGTSDQAPIDKQVELLGQAVPNAKTVGILYTTSERNSEVQVEQAKELLEKAGYKVVVKGITSTNEVQDATTSLMKDVDALFIPTDNTVASTMTMIGELSVEHKVPVIGGSTDMVDEGGLLTYGTNYEALGRQTAKMAIKIIEGANVSETAVEYPETVSLHVNEEMAQKLGIDTSKLAVSE